MVMVHTGQSSEGLRPDTHFGTVNGGSDVEQLRDALGHPEELRFHIIATGQAALESMGIEPPTDPDAYEEFEVKPSHAA